jgi:2-dehydro-3-deoxygluconokinase
MIPVTILGEAMLELAPVGEGSYRLAIAGDTFNTAVGLAQLGCPVEFLSGLGIDPGSRQILEACANWGVGSGLIATVPECNPGLYMIHTDAAGERSFNYWRGESAAHELFSRPDELGALLEEVPVGNLIYLSGITLAIASPDCRAVLHGFLVNYRDRGGRVAFDCNHRSQLWPDAGEAADSYKQILEACDLFFAGEDDLGSAWGFDNNAMPPFLEGLDIETTVLKRGSASLLLMAEGRVREVETEAVSGIVDSTGAGDIFNAGYLAATLSQHNAISAARFANRLGAECLGHRGALLPTEAWRALRDQLIRT